ncbi:MAG: prepilin-type N-terminal cleavage/methylation domain-containing protein, partial [candidate division WOR-3 bacterium]
MKSKCYNVKMLHCYNSRCGFTLIEMLVSIGIITIVIITAVGIYLFTIGPQQKTTATTNLQQDGQLIMNMIAKDVRQNQINYSDYPTCVENCTSIERNYLTLVDSLISPSLKIKYLRCKIGGGACDSSSDCSLKKCRGSTCNDFEDCTNLSNFKDVTMKDVTVTNFKVILNPGCDPFQSGTCSDCDPPNCFKNPEVTIILELKSYKEKVGERRIRL